MKNLFRKTIIIAFIVLFMLPGIAIAKEETPEEISRKNNEILTEICIDVKYIKENIGTIKADIKELQSETSSQDKRITLQEERNIYISQSIDRVDKRDGWLLTIIGSFMAAILIMQVKGNWSSRKEDEDNGKENN